MKKVAIVDDDAFLTSLYEKLLINEGLEVDISNSGEEAFSRLPVFRPNLIVLDLHMPDMHGADVLRAVRNHTYLRDVRVLVFATGPMQSLITEVEDLGVYKVLSKMKCKPRALVAEIKEALSGLEEEAAQIENPGIDQPSI